MLEPIEEAIELAQAGRKASARVLLLAMLKDDPTDEEAWLWMAYCAENADEYSHAIDKLLQLNPHHVTAKRLRKQVAQREMFEQTGRDVLAEQESRRMLWVRQMVGLTAIAFLLFGGVAVAYLLQAPESNDSTPRIITATPQPTPISSEPLFTIPAGEKAVLLTDSQNQLFLIDESGQAFLVAENQNPPLDFPDGETSLSPDGKTRAYQSDHTGGTHIYLEDVDSQTTRQVEFLSGGTHPVWQGDHLIFVSRQTDLFTFDGEKFRHLYSGDFQNFTAGILETDVQVYGEKIILAGQWRKVDAAIDSDLYDVDFISSADGFAVGENSTILHYQNGLWSRMDAPLNERLRLLGVHMLSENEAWAVGERGTILHFLNGVWEQVASPTQDTLYDINFPEILGVTHLIFENGVWRETSTPSNRYDSEGDWSVGYGGLITYRQMPIPKLTYETLYGVSFGAQNDGWAVGANGTLLHFSPDNPVPYFETRISTFDSLEQMTQLTCFILQGELFYEYRLIFEPLQADNSLLATGILPDYSLVLLSGELTQDGLLLQEDSVLQGDYRVQGQLSLRLEEGRLQGSITTDSDELVAEIVACRGGS